MKDERQEKTRYKTRVEERRSREEKIKKSRENQDEREEKRDTMCCVWVCGFDFSFFFSKLPNPRIILNFQKYQLPTLKTFFFRQFFKVKRCE